MTWRAVSTRGTVPDHFPGSGPDGASPEHFPAPGLHPRLETAPQDRRLARATPRNRMPADEPPARPAGHLPVMMDRIVELLAPALTGPDALCLDATVGLGGHAEALLRACPQAVVVGLDRDQDALARAADRLSGFGNRFRPVHAVYDRIPAVLAELGRPLADAVLFDLGVSSMQLDQVHRGFAYRLDAPLDMRMDPRSGPTAADLLNHASAAELERILREYGEERYARAIARAVLSERESDPFSTSARLVGLLHRVIPAASQRSGHPAKRTFQALRIAVNDELQVLQRALPGAVDSLAVGGRVAVLSYHSLEDRMVKKVLVTGSRGSTPAGLPVELPDHAAYLRLLTRGAEQPAQQETQDNPRAASARLRAAERIRRTKGGSG